MRAFAKSVQKSKGEGSPYSDKENSLVPRPTPRYTQPVMPKPGNTPPSTKTGPIPDSARTATKLSSRHKRTPKLTGLARATERVGRTPGTGRAVRAEERGEMKGFLNRVKKGIGVK